MDGITTAERTMMRRLTSVLLSAALLAACGDSSTTEPAARQDDELDPPTSATTADIDATPSTVAATIASTVASAETGDDDCLATDRRTLEVALEAYLAEHADLPTDAAALVEAGLLREEITSFAIDDDGTVVRVPGEPCASVAFEENGESTLTLPEDVDEMLVWLGDDMIRALGGIECATEISAIVVAALELGGVDGPDPESLAALEPYLDRPIELWTLEPGDDEPQPVPGSGCSRDGFDLEPAGSQPAVARADPSCSVDRRTLETALEAFQARSPGEAPPSEAELVEIGYLRAEFDAYDLVGWEVVPTPGGDCEHAEACETEGRTITVAIDAYRAANGADPDNIGQLVDGGFLTASGGLYDVVYGEIVPADDSPCGDWIS